MARPHKPASGCLSVQAFSTDASDAVVTSRAARPRVSIHAARHPKNLASP